MNLAFYPSPAPARQWKPAPLPKPQGWLAWLRNLRTTEALQLGLLLLLLAWAAHTLLWANSMVRNIASQLLPGSPSQAFLRRDTLVMYLYAESDPQYLHNLEYFVREAVHSDERCAYAILVMKRESTEGLPQLPPHAQYVLHPGGPACFDWGAYGWLLASGRVSPGTYRYFFFINASARGPFLPAYARGKVHWTAPFISRLSGDVKLVGSTISCEGAPAGGDVLGTWRRNPHVQSYVVATDRVGLRLLRTDGRVLACHTTRWDAAFYGELGASAAILSAGYNLASLMGRYQGVDWRDTSNWGCNARSSPQGEWGNDGVAVDPLESVFVKVATHTLAQGVSSARKAVKYDAWLQRDAANWTAITSNEFLTHTPQFKVPKILAAQARGSSCFDVAHYTSSNADLTGVLETADAAWHHWVSYGQFEARPYRFTCDEDFGGSTGVSTA